MTHDDADSTGRADHLLILALASGATHEDAARRVGVSRSTVTRRLEDPAFRRAVSRQRGVLVDQACGQAAEALAGAITRLVELTRSGNGPVALGACKALIAAIVQLRSQGEVEERLLEVEGVIAELTASRELRAV